MHERCIIISGGEFCPIKDIKPTDFIIACDKGYEYALRCNIKPNLIVGDFDSYTGCLETDIPVDRYFSEKDDTDTMIAIRYAVDHGFEEVSLRCALGGRLDHLLANIQSAVFAAKEGLRASILDDKTEIYTLSGGSMQLERRKGYSLSLFAISDECGSVTVEGAKYPLENAVISNSFPIGVSNEWAEDLVKISVDKGILLIILSRM